MIGVFLPLLLLILQPYSLRVAIFAFLVLLNFDFSAIAGAGGGASVGMLNAVKALGVPIFLLGRVWLSIPRERRSRYLARLARARIFVLWSGLIAYVALSTLWSPFPAAAIEYVGALVSHTVIFLLFFLALFENRIDLGAFLLFVSTSLVIGLVQSTLFGNIIGGISSLYYFRFSSFVSAQSFAAFLAAALLTLLWYRSKWLPTVLVFGAAALFMTGSRTAFVAFLFGTLLWFLFRLNRRRLLVIAWGVPIAALLALGFFPQQSFQATRIGELTRGLAGEGGDALLENVGTLRWRVGMYGTIIASLEAASPQALLLGHGAASTGEVALRYDDRYLTSAFSPTRVAHNEFLRFLYEFGVIGFLLFSALWVRIVVVTLQGAMLARRRYEYMRFFGPSLSVLPLALSTLLVENVTQAPALMGFTMTLFVLALQAKGWFMVHRSEVGSGAPGGAPGPVEGAPVSA